MKKKRVLIVHNHLDFINEVNEFFLQNGLYTISDYALNGQELLNKKNLDHYDVVIVKNALTEVTGLYALEGLLTKTKHKPDFILLLTPFINDFIANKCKRLGIDYIKNLNISKEEIHYLLCNQEITSVVKGKKYFDTQIEIINLLKKVGLLKTYIGYTYFEYVLNIMFENSENINKYMRTIYQMIGDHFKVSGGSVEKAMRTCLRSSFLNNSGFYSKILFGHFENEFPSTSTFIQVCIKTLKEQKSYLATQEFEKTIRKI